VQSSFSIPESSAGSLPNYGSSENDFLLHSRRLHAREGEGEGEGEGEARGVGGKGGRKEKN